MYIYAVIILCITNTCNDSFPVSLFVTSFSLRSERRMEDRCFMCKGKPCVANSFKNKVEVLIEEARGYRVADERDRHDRCLQEVMKEYFGKGCVKDKMLLPVCIVEMVVRGLGPDEDFKPCPADEGVTPLQLIEHRL